MRAEELEKMRLWRRSAREVLGGLVSISSLRVRNPVLHDLIAAVDVAAAADMELPAILQQPPRAEPRISRLSNPTRRLIWSAEVCGDDAGGGRWRVHVAVESEFSVVRRRSAKSVRSANATGIPVCSLELWKYVNLPPSSFHFFQFAPQFDNIPTSGLKSMDLRNERDCV